MIPSVMLVRRPGTKTFTRWDGRDLAELASTGALHTDRGKYPAAMPWRVAGTWPSASIPASYTDLIPGFSSATVVYPSVAGTIQIERGSPSDTGLLVVEYLDSNWYHRSATYVLSSATVTAAAGQGTGDTVGQPTTAWRILTATYYGAAVNVGQIDIKIGVTNVQARILAGHRASQGLVWTVPRGQRLQISGYRMSVDAGQLVSLRVVGAYVNTSDGTRREVVRNETGEINEHVSDSYRPEMIFGVTATGVRQYGPTDIAFRFKRGATTTSGTLDGTVRGVIMLDEELPDPEPLKIPWVLAEVNRLTAAGLWPLP
jgi:hypothetical protein